MDDLSNVHENDKDLSGNLLGPQEKLILEQISAGGPPHSQRAQSLLAIDAGLTQKIAAMQSGQTVRQVSYWLSKFRRDRMGIFPEEILRQIGVEQVVSGEESISPVAGVKPEQVEGKKVKSKQDKASKKVKKEKKPKKDKASKKKQKGKKKQAKKSKKEKKQKDKKS